MRPSLRVASAVLLFSGTYPLHAYGTQMLVRVLNVADARGAVRVALCRESEWKEHDCSFGAQQPAVAGVVEVQLEVPAGEYGILVHHDANGDGQINRNFFGLPVEGIGFSRDARIAFGFPSFSDVRLSVAGAQTSADVRLIFESRGDR